MHTDFRTIQEKNTWIIGATGMLGSEIYRQLLLMGCENIIATGHEVDITDISRLESFIKIREKVDCIINCAAYTNVEQAEGDKDKAFRINAEGARNIARLAKKLNTKLIHISTDYVFDGNNDKAYIETDEVNPTTIYGQSKAEGEKALLEENPDSFIIRTSWLYGLRGANFVYKMIDLMNNHDIIKVVNDQRGCPTFTGDLAFAILEMIDKEIPFGIYHFSDIGITTWFDFATEIYKAGYQKGLIKHECKVLPCKTCDFPTKAKRPMWSVLSKEKIIKTLDMEIPKWQSSLDFFMEQYIAENIIHDMYWKNDG